MRKPRGMEEPQGSGGSLRLISGRGSSYGRATIPSVLPVESE
jgi:hypothetical protein